MPRGVRSKFIFKAMQAVASALRQPTEALVSVVTADLLGNNRDHCFFAAYPPQVTDLLPKWLDAFVVTSKGSEQIDGSMCATAMEGNPVLNLGSCGCPQEDCLVFVYRTAKALRFIQEVTCLSRMLHRKGARLSQNGEIPDLSSYRISTTAQKLGVAV